MRRVGPLVWLLGGPLSCDGSDARLVEDPAAMAPLRDAEEADEPPAVTPANVGRPDTRQVYRRASEQAQKTLDEKKISSQLEALDALIKTEKDAMR